MRKSVYILICIISLSTGLYGQNDTISEDDFVREMASATTVGIATALHVNKNPLIELGYFQYTIFEFPMTIGESYTIEAYLLDDVIIAPKVNYWMNFLFMNGGLSIPWYFNFHGENSLKFRPEIGFGYGFFKVVYSANISITNKNMENIGKHFLSLHYYLGVKYKD